MVVAAEEEIMIEAAVKAVVLEMDLSEAEMVEEVREEEVTQVQVPMVVEEGPQVVQVAVAEEEDQNLLHL